MSSSLLLQQRIGFMWLFPEGGCVQALPVLSAVRRGIPIRYARLVIC